MTTTPLVDLQSGLLPTGFVSQKLAQELSHKLTLTDAQTAQVSGGGSPYATLYVPLRPILRPCFVRPPISCMPVFNLPKQALTLG